jgi:hypothetical protein
MRKVQNPDARQLTNTNNEGVHMFMLGSLAGLILIIWMVLKIWRSSAVLAIISIFLWPALIFALLKYWGDEESDIKVPFFIFVPVCIYTWYDMRQTAKMLKEQQDTLLTVLQYFA